MKSHQLIKASLLFFALVLASCSFTNSLGGKLIPDAQYNTLVVKADSAMQDGQWKKAAELYEKASLFKPENWDLRLKQANALQLEGKLAQSFNTYQLIIEAPSPISAKTLFAAKLGQAKLGFKNVATLTPVETLKDTAAPIEQVKTEESQTHETIIETQPISEQSMTADEGMQRLEQANSVTVAEDQRILDALNAWTKAWASKKLDAYFAHYVDDFAGDMLNAKTWQQSRRSKIQRSKDIKITLSEVQINKLENSVQLVFSQNYQSDNYKDVGRKNLEMIKVKDRWLIKNETFKEKYER